MLKRHNERGKRVGIELASEYINRCPNRKVCVSCNDKLGVEAKLVNLTLH